MSKPPYAQYSPTPSCAEAILRRILKVCDREAVSGDLLEEYREVVVPERGVYRAQLWYWRQVVSFITIDNLLDASSRVIRKNCRRPALLLTAAGAVVEYTFFFLIPSSFDMSLEVSAFVLAAIVLSVGGLSLIGWPDRAPFRWRTAAFWGLALSVSVLASVHLGLIPLAPAAVLMGAGFCGSLRVGSFRAGTLIGLVSSLIGAAFIVIVAVPGSIFGLADSFQYVPRIYRLIPIGAVLGSAGGCLGRELGGKKSFTRCLADGLKLPAAGGGQNEDQ
jgi:hypothetical protein